MLLLLVEVIIFHRLVKEHVRSVSLHRHAMVYSRMAAHMPLDMYVGPWRRISYSLYVADLVSDL